MSPLWLVSLLIPAAARGAQLGAGASATAGSGGYGRLALEANASGRTETLEPYGWMELSTDDNVRQAGLGGGIWKPLASGLWLKGGAGFLTGRLKGSERQIGSVVLETAVEKELERPTVGAEYTLTWGSIANATALRERTRGRGAASLETERFAYNELAGYAFFPAGRTTVGLRLGAGFGSGASSVTNETVSWRIPVSEPLSVTSSLTFEQAGENYVYGSLGLSLKTGRR